MTILAALLAPAAFAQLVSQSPRPTGRNLSGVAFTSPTHGFIVGDNHHLLETFDAGETWTPRMTDGFSTEPFYTITFFDELHGYIGGNNQDAFRTSDGGQTWTQMNAMLPGSVRVLDFVSPTTGFAGYNGAISWTPDGGQTWELRRGFPDAPIVYGMDFRDENVGLACGARTTPYHDSGIYRTEDGGRTWELVWIENSNDVLWLDETSAIAISGDDVIRSDDEGRTWSIISFDWPYTGLLDIDRAAGSNIIIGVSGVGDIWTSFDLGYSWSQDVEGIGVLPANWSVSMHDSQNGWAVGANGLTYRTNDGAETWRLMNNGAGDEVTSIDFLTDDFGVAVTHRGFVFRTQDRGQTWETRRLRETGIIFGREEGFRAVDVVDEGLILAGGAGGILFRSDDGGENWFNQGYPVQFVPDFEITAIRFTDHSNGWLGGIYGEYSLYRTFDSGFSWFPVEDVGGSIVAIDAEGERIWAATGGDRVHRSVDGGESWSFQDLPGAVFYLSDLEFADPDNGWVVGWWGYMARSTDGGETWTPMERGQNEIYFDIAMNGPSKLLVCGYDNSTFGYFYLRSTNGGATWARTSLDEFDEWFSTLHLRPSGRFWIGGSTGKIVYSPAPPLAITLPSDVPQQVAPGEVYPLPVRIAPGEQQIVRGSETLWFRATPAAPLQQAPLEWLGGTDYLAPLPAMSCTDSPRFYISAEGDGGASVTLPADAPAGTLTTRVGVIEEADLLFTDFETGLPPGWTATGLWHVASACQPPGACGGGNHAYFGQDSTCTFNTGGRVQGRLTSPPITMPVLQADQTVRLTYCYARETQNGENGLSDYDRAEVWAIQGSNSGPIEWHVDRHSASEHVEDLSYLSGRTVQLQWRFDSVNANQNNFRGWHVDDIRLVGPELVCVQEGPGDVDGDGDVDLADLAALLANFGMSSGAARGDGDLSGDGDVDLGDLAELLGNFGRAP